MASGSRVRRVGGALIGGLLWLAASGCARLITGHYVLVRATPNPEAFAVDDADFDSAGRYRALITLGGRSARESGEYNFNGYRLTLRPAAGGVRQFNAVARPGGTLELMLGENKAILKRVGRPRDVGQRDEEQGHEQA